MQVWNKHKFLFQNMELGDVVSMGYSTMEKQKVASALNVEQHIKLSENAHIDLTACPYFFLAFEKRYDPIGSISKMIAYLSEFSHKAGFLYLDSLGTIGLLIPASESELEDIRKVGSFKCYVYSIEAQKLNGFVKSTPPLRNLLQVIENKKHLVENNGDGDMSPRQKHVKFDSIPPTEYVYGNVSSSSKSTDQENLSAIKATADSQSVKDHYNENLTRNQTERMESQIYHLRCLNNWLKSCLIANAIQLTKDRGKSSKKNNDHHEANGNGSSIGISVLDFACGQGGDLMKWFNAHDKSYSISNYVGVDIAFNSLDHFVKERITSLRNTQDMKRVSKLICADLCEESLITSTLRTHEWKISSSSSSSSPISQWHNIIPFTTQDVFDIVSAQFSIHYMFRTIQTAHHFFAEISRHLSPGGVFIATTIDSRVLAEHLSYQLFGDPNHSSSSSSSSPENIVNINTTSSNTTNSNINTCSSQELVFKNEFDSVVLKITFSPDSGWEKLIGSSRSSNNNSSGSSRFPTSHSSSVSSSSSSSEKNCNSRGSDDMMMDTIEEENSNDDDDDDDESAYGIRYYFSLFDSSSSTGDDSAVSASVNAPEYVVPLGNTLNKLAAAHGLRVKKCENFQNYFYQCLNESNSESALRGKGVLNVNGTITPCIWSIARMYVALIFEKIDDSSSSTDATEEMSEKYLFAPSSPTEPPPRALKLFTPSSPIEPPPSSLRFRMPPSPTDTPPSSSMSFMPPSPTDASPSSSMSFMPPSPADAPPSSSMSFMPPSPTDAPPSSSMSFMPPSPTDAPPSSSMSCMPPSPTDAPPGSSMSFMPPSPTDAPPSSSMSFMPPSPTDAPTSSSMSFMPPSPPEAPPGYDSGQQQDDEQEVDREDEDEEDAELMRMLAIRAMAVELAGGDDIWDNMLEEQASAVLKEATVIYDSNQQLH